MDIWHRAGTELLPPEFERILIYRRYARNTAVGFRHGSSWITDGSLIDNEINVDDYWMSLPAPPDDRPFGGMKYE